MCLAPKTVRYVPGDPGNLQKVQVACGYCSLCRDNRVNDIIGRSIAEQSTATHTFAVTLTYSGDTPESASLRYSDIQTFLKFLRKDGYTVRYMVAGEYGTKKGRAHWHIILFFYGKIPAIQMDRRVDWKYWRHGFVYFQNPDYKGFKYVMKYALKGDSKTGDIRAFGLSKKPPLGYQFFMQLASEYVEKGLAIHSPEYSFAGVLNSKGVPRKYWLRGRMREMFLERYCELWAAKYKQPPPYTDFLLEGHLDRIARKEMDLDPLRIERGVLVKDAEYERKLLSERQRDLLKIRHVLGVCSIDPSKRSWASVFSDNTASVHYMGQSWLLSVGNVPVDQQIKRLPCPLTNLQRLALVQFCLSGWQNRPRIFDG